MEKRRCLIKTIDMEKRRCLIKTIDMVRTYVYIKLFNKNMCFRLGLKIEFKFREIKKICKILSHLVRSFTALNDILGIISRISRCI